VLCPRNSEADDTLRVMDIATDMNQFMILVNPELVNMGTTGYGLAGRRIRDLVLSTFNSAYYLRTLAWGAVTKRYVYVHVQLSVCAALLREVRTDYSASKVYCSSSNSIRAVAIRRLS
jgi:Domain of unknown function (DUF1995)